MVVHLYALCWNEQKMLPYFFKYYDSIVDRYFIFDNDSEDGSLSILHAHSKVAVNRFEIQGGSLIQSALKQFNHFWKQSRETADWIIVCDIDEHLYHPDLRGYLAACALDGITVVIPEGYEMISDGFPDSGKPLHETVRLGVRDRFLLDKPQIFNPREIIDINFTAGRHSANPSGNVIMPVDKEVKLLHYKYIGFDYLNSRLSELKQGLQIMDVANQWGVQYLWDERTKLQKFKSLKQQAVQVL